MVLAGIAPAPPHSLVLYYSSCQNPCPAVYFITMNTVPRKFSRFLTAAFLGCVAIAFIANAARADEDIGELYGTIPVVSGLTAKDVQNAIILSLGDRGWNIQSRSDERVVGYLKHRANEATVTLDYNENEIVIHCVGYEINKKTGERKRPEQPKGWLGFLRKSINQRLSEILVSK